MTNDLGATINLILQQDSPMVGLDQFLQETPTDRYSDVNEVFVQDATLTFPDYIQVLLKGLKDHQHPPHLGLLTEIHQIWLATGPRIYFLDTVNKTVFTYEAKEKVDHVGLVKAKPGIFDVAIEWVLVVSTGSRITMTGLKMTPTLKLDSSSRSVRSGIRMGSIVGTHNGRILMLGKDDGHIYELEYTGGTDRLICHTDQSLQSLLRFIPIQLKSSLDIKTKYIDMDHERKIVIALTEKSSLQIYCLDDGHLTFTRGALLSDIHDQFVSFLLSPSLEDPTKMPAQSTIDILGSTLAPRPFDLVSIHSISKKITRDPTLCFYAVTSHGCRLYFKADSPIITHQTKFTLHQVRLPPFDTTAITCSFQTFGAFATSRWITSYQEQGSRVEETWQTLDADIYALSQQPSLNHHSYYYEQTRTFYNAEQPRTVVLTRDGALRVYKKQRPVDLVALALDDLSLCEERYGVVPTYTMVLDILSSGLPHANVLRRITMDNPKDCNTALISLYSRWIKNLWQDTDILKSDRLDRLVYCHDGLNRLYELVRTYSAFQSTVVLLSTTIQVISLLIFLIQHPIFDSEGYKEKRSLADLVTTQSGHNSLESLIVEAIQQVASSDQAMISPFLITHCPTLFTTAATQLYQADEMLTRAEQQPQRKDYLEAALDQYLLAKENLTPEARNRVCRRFHVMQYPQGVISLALQPSQPDYTPILALLDQENIAPILHLTLVMHPDHTALHHAIYTWLISHDQMQLLYSQHLTLPHLVPFLESENQETRLEWLYKYYDHQHQADKAVEVLTRLATEIRSVPLDHRINYLHHALDRAHEPTQLQHQYETALVQRDILTLWASPDDRLLSRLVPVSDLLQDYAVPLELWEQVLVLLRLSTGSFDYALMYTAWTRLIQSIDTQRFVDLGKRLYPSPTTFSIYLLIDMMESRKRDTDNVVDLFLQIGVDRAVLLDVYEFLAAEQPQLGSQLAYLTSSS